MRITGGAARGIPLRAPKGTQTRPATDRMREAIFSRLGSRISQARVADLYAGTGSYGLEALSRGAAQVHFFEKNPAALHCLEYNCKQVLKSGGFEPESTNIHRGDLLRQRSPIAAFDLIFVDPPYDQIATQLQSTFSNLVASLSHPDTWLLIELPGHLELNFSGWRLNSRIGKADKNKPSLVIFRRDTANSVPK